MCQSSLLFLNFLQSVPWSKGHTNTIYITSPKVYVKSRCTFFYSLCHTFPKSQYIFLNFSLLENNERWIMISIGFIKSK